MPKFFWINHSAKHHQVEVKQGYLVAAKAIEGGTKLEYRENLGKAVKDDVLFICYQRTICYIAIVTTDTATTYVDAGTEYWRVYAEFFKLKSPVDIVACASHLTAIKRDYLAPINKNGLPQQGAHVSEIDLDMASYLMAQAGIYIDSSGVHDISKGPNGRVHNIKGLMSGLTEQQVKETLNHLNKYEAWRYCYSHSTTYDLVYDGFRYPPKVVFGFSALHIIHRVLISDEFSGGLTSECFSILHQLGFYIEPKSTNVDRPMLFRRYSREDISQVFEPGSKFTRGSGRWGISGIIRLKNESDDLVFIVTIEKPHEGNPYGDYLTDDGVLSWQTQKRMAIDNELVERLIAHEPNTSNIHLFLREARDEDQRYIYLGLLAYSWHDETSSKPVHFQWRLVSNGVASNLRKQLNAEFLVPMVYTETHKPKIVIEDFNPDVFKIIEVAAPFGNTQEKKQRNVISKRRPIDWAASDERNRALGDMGEKLVMTYERKRLQECGRADLAAKVEHIAASDCAAGYDIKSFDQYGAEILIEVKTTKAGRDTPFFISANEVAVAARNNGKYWLYRVHCLDVKNKTCEVYTKNGSVSDIFELEPVSFKAKIK